MRPGGDPDAFSTMDMVHFQDLRRSELRRWANGDLTAEPPATGLTPPRLPWNTSRDSAGRLKPPREDEAF